MPTMPSISTANEITFLGNTMEPGKEYKIKNKHFLRILIFATSAKT